MDEASDELRFEEAAAWRDRIEILKNFQSGHSLVTFRGENRDVFGICREGAQATLCVLMVRSGRILETKTFHLFEVGVSDEELLEASIEQFYDGRREIPEEILVPREFENQSMIEAGLKVKHGGTVSVIYPQRGSRARLLEMAELNARQGFLNNLTFESEWNAVAAGLAKLVGLKQLPRRVECVDISNLQGSDIVGAIVVFFDGVADRSSYRRYNISQQGKPNDFASMYEVVHRRLKRGMEEGTLPDLLVIDGGPGQLSMAIQASDELRCPVDIISLAKMRTASEFESQQIERKPERVYITGREEPIELAEGDLVTRFLARIRDEVHRYVITFHRQKRAKRVIRSKLDDILGVGPERRRRLLKHYKSIDAIGSAPADEVARIGRMPLPLAEKIKAALTAK
jgi:excinuclease ABC subunit C